MRESSKHLETPTIIKKRRSKVEGGHWQYLGVSEWYPGKVQYIPGHYALVSQNVLRSAASNWADGFLL